MMGDLPDLDNMDPKAMAEQSQAAFKGIKDALDAGEMTKVINLLLTT